MAIKASATITLSFMLDVSAVYRYYKLQSSTASVPTIPTTNPPDSSWKLAEPTYTSGSTNSLYTTDLTVFSDNTFVYSNVCLSSSYEAAKVAYNKAAAAQITAESAQTSADEAAKTATNFMEYTDDGLRVGNKANGEWSGVSTRINNNSFDILDANGNIVSSYGVNDIILGYEDLYENLYNSISMCGGMFSFYLTVDDNDETVAFIRSRCETMVISSPEIILIGGLQEPETDYINITSNKNLLLYGGEKVTINGETTHDSIIKAPAFIATGMNGLRIAPSSSSDKPAFFIRNDGNSTYFMLTDANASDKTTASYNNLRPLSINNTTGNVTFANGVMANCDLNISSTNKLKFNTYGGGFYMSDTTWIRTIGSKSIYMNAGTFRTDGKLQVGGGGTGISYIGAGSMIGNPSGNTSLELFTQTSINNWGGSSDSTKTVVLVANGDSSNSTHVEGATYVSSSKKWVAVFNTNTSSTIRINYLIVCWG